MDEKQIERLVNRYGFQLIETHISWVLIGDELVYKIKKPVDFGFLDYTTLEKRKHFCQEEIRLNRRLAEEIYIGVSRIVSSDGELLIDEDGELVDYAVKMKRMPQDRMMNLLIENNTIKDEEVDALARKVAEFHKRADTNEYISSFGSVEVNKTNTDENFVQTKDAVGEYITRFEYESIKRYTDAFYRKYSQLFDERISSGRIRECHGDMYSRNVCIVDAAHIYIYDCIEFNERFRYSDVASDVAFMLMDLENYQRWDLSELFLKRYLEYSQDDTLLDVLDFYKVYRAYVRGKIAYFQQNVKEANAYFDLAFGYLEDSYKPKLVMLCGLTGAGKSYIAQRLKEAIGAVVLSSDVIRKQLAGMNPEDRDLSEFGKGIYTPEITQRVYQELAERAYALLRDGKNVILDATFLKNEYRRAVEFRLKRLGIKPLIVLVDIDDEKALEHFKKRKEYGGVSDGRYEIYLKQKELFERPTNCIVVDGSDDADTNLRMILRALSSPVT